MKEQIAMEGNLVRLAIGGFAGSWIFIFSLTVCSGCVSDKNNNYRNSFVAICIGNWQCLFSHVLTKSSCQTVS